MAGSSIASKARAAAEALGSEAEAPANDCCSAGEQAFQTSESVLAAEYAQMVEALDQAQAELLAQAEANRGVWITAEQQIQTWGSLSGATVANLAARLVIAEANATEAAFETAESSLAAQIASAEVAIQSAEQVLSAEQAFFLAEAGCGEAEAE